MKEIGLAIGLVSIAVGVIYGGYKLTDKIVDKAHDKWLRKRTKFIKRKSA